MKRYLGVVLGGLLAVGQPVSAQWIDYPTKGLPRTADGKFNPAAPTPRAPDGKPDLSGLWNPSFVNSQSVAAELKQEPPLLPAAAKLLKQRIARLQVDDPSAACLPPGPVVYYSLPPIKILQRTDLVVMLYEPWSTYRQIFLDGRPFPTKAEPTYMGYAVGHWENDTLVVESTGYNGKLWLDSDGLPSTDKLHLTERIQRPTFGRLEISLTIDDPGAYTKPWTIHRSIDFLPDSELMEEYCEHNEYFQQVERLEKKGALPRATVPAK
jgi:hypothetical protein